MEETRKKAHDLIDNIKNESLLNYVTELMEHCMNRYEPLNHATEENENE